MIVIHVGLEFNKHELVLAETKTNTSNQRLSEADYNAEKKGKHCSRHAHLRGATIGVYCDMAISLP